MQEKKLNEELKNLKKEMSKIKRERDKAVKELEKKVTVTDVVYGFARSFKDASDAMIDLEKKAIRKKKRPYTQSYQVGDVEIELKAVVTDERHVKFAKKEEGEEISTIKFKITPQITLEEE